MVLQEWIEERFRQLDRKNAEVMFSLHLFDRKNYHNLDLDNIEDTVRNGSIFEKKSEEPNKICFIKYFGKENRTYVVIVRFHKNFIEVKTAWQKKGR